MPTSTSTATVRARANGRKDLRVGQTVVFDFGGRKTRALVLEDRGHIGNRGRQIVRIQPKGRLRLEVDPFEMAAEELTLVD